MTDADADARAREIEGQMTDDERFSLLVSVMGQLGGLITERDERIPEGTPMSSGHTPGIERLGVPALRMSDASLGVTNPGFANRDDDGATALPSSLALAASFSPALARAGGAVIGREARVRGLNVMLGGGINLCRDPRNGRNFEYLSEDPLLSGVLGGEHIAGVQGERVICTAKHFSLNVNETNRHTLDARIDHGAHRESDLLAFEIAVERGRPGSVMGAYNMVNGVYAGRNDLLINGVLKGAWGFPGWVMSDWGATPEWEYALGGLDQECGLQIDVMTSGATPFVEPLRAAYEDGELPPERLADMVRRILRSMFAVGIDAWDEPVPQVDMAAHRDVALDEARQGSVLLHNDGVLPLAAGSGTRIAAIGGYANVGVVSGTGSAPVRPPGGYAGEIFLGGPGVMGFTRRLLLTGPSPVDELRERAGGAVVEFDPGMTPAEAALLAARSDVAIVFAIRIEGEGFDSPDLALPWGQDAVIEAVADANPNTIVVLQTGNPVAMPWLPKVRAVLQAWYPGLAGAQAIAELLTGAVNPSGRLPVTFPASLNDTPRPQLPGLGTAPGTPVTIDYHEGADVGYRWFARTGAAPLFAFGHGLSYTSFAYDGLRVEGGETIAATFTVTNTGERAGADVPQLYLTDAPGETRMRLLAFERVELEPGETREVTLVADERLLARFDTQADCWQIEGGTHRVALGRAADGLTHLSEAVLAERQFGR
jgi:beta-glucosidase